MPRHEWNRNADWIWPPETFRVAQMAQTSKAGNAVAALSARLAAGGGSRSEVIRERQDLVQLWQWLDGDLVKAVSRATAERNQPRRRRYALADVSRRLDTLDTRIAEEFPAYAELSNPRPLTGAGCALAARER